MKVPKNCRELCGIVADLQKCISMEKNEVNPVKASGSSWVRHKLNMMRHILSNYGVYTAHLAALSDNHSIKSTDRAKFRVYCNQWLHVKYVLGCAVFVDILTPYAIFSKVMKSDELDILSTLGSLLRTVKDTEKLSTLPLAERPVYSSTLKEISTDQ